MTKDEQIEMSKIYQSKYALTQEERDKLAAHKTFKLEKDKEQAAKKGSWESKDAAKEFTIIDFVKFSFPFMWEGDWTVKLTTIITFFMLIASRALAIIHPIILRKIIYLISCVYGV